MLTREETSKRLADFHEECIRSYDCEAEWALFVNCLRQKELMIMKDKGPQRKTITAIGFNHFIFSNTSHVIIWLWCVHHLIRGVEAMGIRKKERATV